MKKFFIFLFTILLLPISVFAKDTVYSINQYSEEVFSYILKDYNDEGTVNGHVVAGTFLKKESNDDGEEFEHTQVMIVKYKKNGNVSWNYHYGDSGNDNIYGLVRYYDSDNNSNGYVAVVKETYEKEDDNNNILFLVINSKGKLEKEVSANCNGIVTEIIETHNDLHKVDGYVIIGKNDSKSFIIKYDLELNKIWEKEYSNYSSFDEVVVVDDTFKIISSIEIDDVMKKQLIQFDSNGDNLTTINDSFEEIDSPRIFSLGSSYVIYGYTNEVKLNKKNAVSYYIKQYNSNDEVTWETIGDIAVSHDQLLEIQPIYKEGDLYEYYFLYTNDRDSSIEILRIDLDGVVQNKIKKIKNNYYHINAFLSDGKTIYFIGQINCPADDNCEYDTNSLFLVSDEDKVIEVKDKINYPVIIVIGLVMIAFIGLIILRKRKK